MFRGLSSTRAGDVGGALEGGDARGPEWASDAVRDTPASHTLRLIFGGLREGAWAAKRVG